MTRLATRVLLTCAAIAVAGALLIVPINAVVGPAAAALPLLWSALQGIWYLPGALAQRLLRRPGVAVLTAALVGTLISLVSPFGFSAWPGTVAIGLLQELPFAATLYRRWHPVIFAIGGVAFGVLNGVLFTTVFDADALAPWLRIAIVPVATLSVVAGTLLGVLLADRVRRTGVGRGLEPRSRERTRAEA